MWSAVMELAKGCPHDDSIGPVYYKHLLVFVSPITANTIVSANVQTSPITIGWADIAKEVDLTNNGWPSQYHHADLTMST